MRSARNSAAWLGAGCPVNARPRSGWCRRHVPPFARAAFTGVVACGPACERRLAAIRQVLAPIATIPAHVAHVRPCRVHGRRAALASRRCCPRGPVSRRGHGVSLGRDPAGAGPSPPTGWPFPPTWPDVRPCRVHGRCGLWHRRRDVGTGTRWARSRSGRRGPLLPNWPSFSRMALGCRS
jgi:hypothetical protein